MTRRGSLRLAFAFCLFACHDDPTEPPDDTTGLRITSREPPEGATGIPVTSSITATLSAAIDPATLGPASVGLSLRGVSVPAELSYDVASRQIRLTAPLLPGFDYRVALGSALRSLEGDSLVGSKEWTFGTRPWQPVAISSVGELRGFDLEIGPSGSIHLVGDGEHYLRPGNDFPDTYVKYVTCAADCMVPANWSRVAIDSAWLPGSGAIEQDDAGVVHLLHISHSPAPSPDFGHPVKRYGVCPADCSIATNWSIATVDSAPNYVDYGYLGGFAVAGEGTVHLLTLPAVGGTPDLEYATCALQCTLAANWSRAPIPVAGYTTALNPLKVDRTGRLHLLSELDGVVTYSTCPADCTSAGQWTSGPVRPNGLKAYSSSFTLDGGGRVHLAFSDPSYSFHYAVCEAACTNPSSWATVRLDQGDYVGSAVAANDDGRLTLLNPLSIPGELRYLTCAVRCLDAGNWQIAAVERPDIFNLPTPGPPRLALGPNGSVRMMYGDMASALHYLE